MHACLGAHFRNEGADATSNDLLGIRLTRVDHVVNRSAISENRPHQFRRRRRVGLSGSHPGDMSVLITPERPVVEIEPEVPELPELIRYILTRVSYGAIRTHDDLIGLVFIRSGMRLERHYPAPGMSSFGFKLDHAGLLHQFECAFPKMKVQNVGLAS